MVYDVLVVGGGTAGCAAAYTAGRLGLKTILIEKNSCLGGTMTTGLVSPAMKTSENQINTDFFNDLVAELKKINAQITYSDGNQGWFNPELTKIALDRLMAKANVEVRFNTHPTGVNIIDRGINGVTVSSDMLSVYIGARYVIDATGNCEIGKISGCEFLEDNSKISNNRQPTTLRFIMDNIHLKAFSQWLLDFDKNREVTTASEIDGAIHLSTAYTWDEDKNWALKPLFDDAVANNILKNEDRNYFQVFTIPEMSSALAFNCPRIYFEEEIDPLDAKDVSKALVEGREAILRIAEFCKIYFPGFENAYISNISDSLGVRVSRRIAGKYIYTKDDLISGKVFENPVLVGNYPIDIHSNRQGDSVLMKSGEYQLPIDSLMSKNYANLFVVGRCLSADFYAQGALRIQPACFSMGEGAAKYIFEKISEHR